MMRRLLVSLKVCGGWRQTIGYVCECNGDEFCYNGYKSIDRFNQQTNSASYAPVNINRVIQDTPYGFMGISIT